MYLPKASHQVRGAVNCYLGTDIERKYRHLVKDSNTMPDILYDNLILGTPFCEGGFHIELYTVEQIKTGILRGKQCLM